MPKRILTRVIVIAGLLLAAVLPGGAEAREPVVLKPVTKWHLEWSPTTCSLRRGFGDADHPDIVLIEQFGPTDYFQVALTSKQLKNFTNDGKLWLRFGTGERGWIKHPTKGKTRSGVATIFIITTSLLEPAGPENEDEEWRHPTPEQEAQANSLSVGFPGKSIVFDTGPLNKAFAALRGCTDDLVKSWGFDPAQQASLSKRPEPLTRRSTWLRSTDYPRAMVNMGRQALVNFRLTVDDKGVPRACEVQRSYNEKAFDDTTCANLMRRARFSPAIDAKGKAVPSYYINTVRWVMQP